MKYAMLAIVMGFAAAACAPDEQPVTNGCAGTSDCPIGTACDPAAHACVPLNGERVIGTFTCLVYAAGQPPVFGTGDVLGELGGDRLGLASGGVACKRSSATKLFISFEGPSRDHDSVVLFVALDPAVVQAGAVVPVEDNATYWEDEGSGGLVAFDTEEGEYLAATVGIVRFESGADGTEPLRGSLDLRLVPTTKVTGLGQTCASVRTCGPEYDWYCRPFAADSTRSLCYPDCSTATGEAMCGALGGVCASGVCGLPCDTTACPAPTVCASFGGPKFCY